MCRRSVELHPSPNRGSGLVVVLVRLGLPRVGVRVFERMLLVVVFLLLLDTAVAVFAWVLLTLWSGHPGLRFVSGSAGPMGRVAAIGVALSDGSVFVVDHVFCLALLCFGAARGNRISFRLMGAAKHAVRSLERVLPVRINAHRVNESSVISGSSPR